MAISQNFAAISPTLSLNFARSKALDPRITFTRTTTGTVLNERGVIETIPAGSPRFDHAFDSSTGSIRSSGLLIEEGRTNLEPSSVEFTNANSWLNVRSSFTSNVTATLDPAGTTTADKLVEDTTVSNSHFGYKIYSGLTQGATYTFSVFVKRAERFKFSIGAWDGVSGLDVYIDLNTGTLDTAIPTGVTLVVIPYPNGWYRICYTRAIGQTTLQPTIYISTPPTNAFYTGDGTSGIYLWGAQLELGRFATSYIPTTTTTVTRAIDQAFMTGTTNFDNWFNPAQGTTLIRSRMPLNRIGTGTFRSLAQIIKTSTYNSDSIFTYIGASGSHAMEARSGSTNIANINNSTAYAEGDTTISTYSVLNDCAVSTRGESPVTGSFGGRPSGLDRIIIGNVGDYNTQGTLNGTISHLVYYPRRLSNAQLQTLTRQ